MSNRSCWEDIKKERRKPPEEVRAGVERDLALGQLVYDLRIEVGLSQSELAERMGKTQSVISRLKEGGGARNRIDTLARTPPHGMCFVRQISANSTNCAVCRRAEFVLCA